MRPRSEVRIADNNVQQLQQFTFLTQLDKLQTLNIDHNPVHDDALMQGCESRSALATDRNFQIGFAAVFAVPAAGAVADRWTACSGRRMVRVSVDKLLQHLVLLRRDASQRLFLDKEGKFSHDLIKLLRPGFCACDHACV